MRTVQNWEKLAIFLNDNSIQNSSDNVVNPLQGTIDAKEAMDIFEEVK